MPRLHIDDQAAFEIDEIGHDKGIYYFETSEENARAIKDALKPDSVLVVKSGGWDATFEGRSNYAIQKFTKPQARPSRVGVWVSFDEV